ncbi:hypothetical protein EVAR_9588_1 [Eumeta japonica]|uniref:Uncharacterized protein n=1 Tax=Eumeta variegata TaxID=151549 RepID=A0A4C1TMJ9_EUMVA|nr:hypothetical protein EVAR_9588_1 [Eumeta japonica]
MAVVYWRNKRADEASESRWSPSPMDTRNVRSINLGFGLLGAIEYLIVGNRFDESSEGEWATGTLTH